MQLGKPKK